jgi:hypothetical protein
MDKSLVFWSAILLAGVTLGLFYCFMLLAALWCLPDIFFLTRPPGDMSRG